MEDYDIKQKKSLSDFIYYVRGKFESISVKMIKIPISSQSVKKQNGEEIVSQLKKCGFKNITEDINYVSGIFTFFKRNGQIKIIEIAGKKSFQENEEYRSDTPIIIKYYLKKHN